MSGEQEPRDRPFSLYDTEDAPLTHADVDAGDETDAPDECPAGGEHLIVEVRASTGRDVLARYCPKCRTNL